MGPYEKHPCALKVGEMHGRRAALANERHQHSCTVNLALWLSIFMLRTEFPDIYVLR